MNVGTIDSPHHQDNTILNGFGLLALFNVLNLKVFMIFTKSGENSPQKVPRKSMLS